MNGQANGHVVELIGVTKKYKEVTALKDVSLEVERGKVVSLLGPNGAGKTTSLSLMMGALNPTAGSVRVFGRDPRVPANRVHVGIMLQDSGVPATLTVRDLIGLFASYYPAPWPIEDTVALAGLQGLEARQAGRLSGGQAQRLMFALAICGDPTLLMLDEPTTGLDVESCRALWQCIRGLVARDHTILLATQRLEEADVLSDRVVVLHEGQIIADGTPAEIKALVPTRRIRCKTRLPAREIRALSGVRRVEKQGATMELLVDQAEPVVYTLLQRDGELADLEVHNASLEEAFLALTQAGVNHEEVGP